MKYKYRINNNRSVFYTGLAGDSHQVIIGLLAPEMAIYYFDISGLHLRKEKKALKKPPKRSNSGGFALSKEFYEGLQEEYRENMESIQYTPRKIQVYEFFDSHDYVGIRRFPSIYQEYLEYPARFEAEQAASLETCIQEWIESEMFVFCWAEEYWVTKQGDIEST